MDEYEQQYRCLKAHGFNAWTGDGYERAYRQLVNTLDKLMVKNLLPAAKASVLELGCGNGAMSSRYMAKNGYSVYGVDISPTAVKWAAEDFSRLGLTGKFSEGDVCHLGQYQSQMFDMIVDGSCLHCLINEQRHQCFQEVKRLLKPEGRFIISTMCGLPQSPEDIQNYDYVNHHLIRNGSPWRTLKPLPILQEEILQERFTIVDLEKNTNPWWDHATIVCRC